MKRTLLFAIFLFVVSTGFAQLSFSFEQDTVVIEGITTTDEIIAHNPFTNNATTGVGHFHWERVIVSMPENAWTSWICDPNVCYLPGASAANFTLDANTTSNFDLHIVPSEIVSGEEIEIHIDLVNTDDTTQAVTVVYIFRAGEVQGVDDEEVQAAPILIYPNPTFDYINLKNGESVGKVVIYNIMGRAIKTFYTTGARSFDISELTEGMYLVGLFDRNNNIIKTLRVSKRSLMP